MALGMGILRLSNEEVHSGNEINLKPLFQQGILAHREFVTSPTTFVATWLMRIITAAHPNFLDDISVVEHHGIILFVNKTLVTDLEGVLNLFSRHLFQRAAHEAAIFASFPEVRVRPPSRRLLGPRSRLKDSQVQVATTLVLVHIFTACRSGGTPEETAEMSSLYWNINILQHAVWNPTALARIRKRMYYSPFHSRPRSVRGYFGNSLLAIVLQHQPIISQGKTGGSIHPKT
ncbi:hypothetical protein C8J57DRAFT_1236118 [Mycena rebaudengoi]|nr:hypothetical protein C8J57DRAFT_1236118 [Mycena rebaudengoi]